MGGVDHCAVGAVRLMVGMAVSVDYREAEAVVGRMVMTGVVMVMVVMVARLTVASSCWMLLLVVMNVVVVRMVAMGMTVVLHPTLVPMVEFIVPMTVAMAMMGRRYSGLVMWGRQVPQHVCVDVNGVALVSVGSMRPMDRGCWLLLPGMALLVRVEHMAVVVMCAATERIVRAPRIREQHCGDPTVSLQLQGR